MQLIQVLGFEASSSTHLTCLSMCPLLQKEDHTKVDLKLLFNIICAKHFVSCIYHEKHGSDFISLMARKTAMSHGDLICMSQADSLLPFI